MLKSTKIFRDKMKIHGKKIDIWIEYENISYHKNKVVSLEQNINGELFTSICRALTLELEKIENVTFEKETEINVKLGVKIDDDEEYEYIDWGKFVIYDVKDCVDTKSHKLTLYDHLIDTHIKYQDEPLNLDYSNNDVTVKDLLQAICNKFGFALKNLTFANSNKIIHEDKYLNLDVTYRDILDEIAGCAGGFIKIFNKDLYVLYPTETEGIIDETDLKSLDIGKKVGAFNTLVLSRAPQEDNIFYPANMENNDDRVAIRIENNQIMDKNREDFIVDLYSEVNDLQYYVFECEHYGFGYFEFGDIVTIKDLDGNLYKTILLNIVDNVNTGITGKSYADETEFAETKYEYASSLEKRVKNTEIICDKQNGEIKLIVEEQVKQEEKVAQIELDIDSIIQKVENIADLTKSMNGIKTITIEDAVAGSPIELRILGNNTVFESLFLSDDLFLGNSTILNGDACIEINDVVYDLGIDEVLRQYEGVYDEYVFDYTNKTAKVIRRIGVREDGLYVLTKEIVESLPVPDFAFVEGINTIVIPSYSANLLVRYVVKNDYTNMFATRVELKSNILQTAEEIKSEVGKDITTAKGELEKEISSVSQTAEQIQHTVEKNSNDISKVTQTANSISQEVNKKVDNSEIIAKLNIAVQEKQGIVELIGNIVRIVSDNFTLDENGVITAKAGMINGFSLTTENGLPVLKGDNLGLAANSQVAIWVDNSGKRTFQVQLTGEVLVSALSLLSGYGFDHDGNLSCRTILAGGMPLIQTLPEAHSGNQGTETSRIYRIAGQTIFALDVTNSGTWTIPANIPSDKKLKENIEHTSMKALEVINKIQFRQFDWKREEYQKLGFLDFATHEDFGVVADELEKVNSRFVVHTKQQSGDVLKTVNREELIYYNSKAIQELCEEKENLRRELEEQRKQIDFILSKMEERG